MTFGAASDQRLKIKERRIYVLELRKQGGTYRQIAAQLRQLAHDNPEEAAEMLATPDYNESQAYKDILAELKELNKRAAELAEENRRLELERIDDLWATYYPKAVKGDTLALNSCLNLMTKRAALLGLNAPVEVKQTVTTVNVTADDLAQARDRAAKFEKSLMEGTNEHTEEAK